MDVAITGSTGLIGTALVRALADAGHRPIRIVRSSAGDDVPSLRWDIEAGTIDAAALDGVDAVVHLAGEGIAEKRWTDEQKRRIVESRTKGTTLLSETLAGLANPPAVLVSGSAIGVYGDRGDEVLTEESATGDDFLSDVCRRWEASTAAAEAAGIRVAHARTGIVQSVDGGALGEVLPFFKLGIGGKIGNGRQYWSWISITDEIRALIWLLEHDVSGAVNLTAPQPVTNGEFTTTLGKVLGRPTFLPTPKPALWARLGRELTEALLYTSARVVPGVLDARGFEFHHRDLESALRAALDR